MTYTTGIPRSGQSLGNSRPKVEGNFDYINTAFAVNHIAFNSSGAGRHKFVDLVEVGTISNPISPPTPPAEVDTLFTKVAAGLGELFYVRGAGGTPIQMTTGDPLASSNGYSFLPGGLLVQWGSTGSIGSSLSVSYNINFPNSIFSTVITGTSSNKAFRISANSTTGFTVTPIDGGSSASSIYWIAIGN